MTSAIDISDRYIDRLVELDPVLGTSLGVAEAASRLPDFSPGGVEARAALGRQTAALLGAVSPTGGADRRARDVLAEALATHLELHALGEPFRELRNFGSPLERVRSAFDLMPHESPADWPAVVERMTAVPGAIAGITETLREGQRRGIVAARRQAAVVAAQAKAWGGGGGSPGYFTRLVSSTTVPAGLTAAARDAAHRAEDAMRGLSRFLEAEYAATARADDAAGRETYAVWARHFNGLALDLDETYRWGWDELRRVNAEMAETAALIVPGGDVAQARAVLNEDPENVVEGVDRFRQWLQELTERAVGELNGRHFDMSPEAQRIECMIAPPGGGAAMYYTPPTEDWSRPGRTWYPAGDRTVFPTWEEVTTAYHEGVPGHHLQTVAVKLSSQPLSRFQRNHFSSGHGEGWALYSERLMDELGYHEQPGSRLGMLMASAFRAARVVLDIGLHLELPVPADAPFHPGERWTYDLAREFLAGYAARGGPFVTSEIDRYLGMPGQAISYKVGEREWLDIRREVRSREGSSFDLRAFHTRALDLGPMGLAQLRAALTQQAP